MNCGDEDLIELLAYLCADRWMRNCLEALAPLDGLRGIAKNQSGDPFAIDGLGFLRKDRLAELSDKLGLDDRTFENLMSDAIGA
jgi:hypothetical protein